MPIGFGIESGDFNNFGNPAPAAGALDVDDDLDRVGDLALERSVGDFEAGLQDATAEPGDCLPRRVGVNRGQAPGMAGVQRLKQVVGFLAPDFADDQPVGAFRAPPQGAGH